MTISASGWDTDRLGNGAGARIFGFRQLASRLSRAAFALFCQALAGRCSSRGHGAAGLRAARAARRIRFDRKRSEEHTSELQSLMRISYAVFCLKKKKEKQHHCKHSKM